MMGEYYKTKESVKEYIKAAEGFNGKKQILKLEKILPKGSEVLELGSGPGTDWQIINEIYNVVGSDFSDDFLNHLRKSFPSGEFVNLNAATLEIDRKFDCIYSNKVLQHLNDDEFISSIKKQYELLKPGGVICHTVWKGEGSEIFKGMFVNYYTKSGLLEKLSDYFEVLELNTYQEFDEDDSLSLLARKKAE